jgi:hypothetical protein
VLKAKLRRRSREGTRTVFLECLLDFHQHVCMGKRSKEMFQFHSSWRTTVDRFPPFVDATDASDFHTSSAFSFASHLHLLLVIPFQQVMQSGKLGKWAPQGRVLRDGRIHQYKYNYLTAKASRRAREFSNQEVREANSQYGGISRQIVNAATGKLQSVQEREAARQLWTLNLEVQRQRRQITSAGTQKAYRKFVKSAWTPK